MYDIDTLARINKEPEIRKWPVPASPEPCSCTEVEWLRSGLAQARLALMDRDRDAGYDCSIESIAECDRILSALIGKE